VILIVADDLGYADVGVYEPRLCHAQSGPVGAAGIRFTDFHVPSGLLASRAGI